MTIKHGWNFTLRHLIERYKEALQYLYQPQEEYLERCKPITHHTDYPFSLRRMDEEESETKLKEKIPLSNLKYFNKVSYGDIDRCGVSNDPESHYNLYKRNAKSNMRWADPKGSAIVLIIELIQLDLLCLE